MSIDKRNSVMGAAWCFGEKYSREVTEGLRCGSVQFSHSVVSDSL